FAMRSPTGDDVSPHGLWQATMMANSFRDPYWRGTVAKEIAHKPGQAAEIQAVCVRCHAPMAHHTAALAGEPAATVAEMASDPLAQDGVSCTVCHKIEAENLGTEASFSGRPSIGRNRAIFGPFADPAAGPMQMHSGYEPQLGSHIQSSAHCATCHTLSTHYSLGKSTFPEQTPYLEWRNSQYSDENGRTEQSRTCQECHMPDMGTIKIARNPGGRDFLIQPRPFRAHAFTGGNAFMLDMLGEYREELGVSAPKEALGRMAMATRAQLADRTALVTVTKPERHGDQLEFAVQVENLTGHKFPTGYPARRAWLRVQVRAGNQLVFESGKYDETGRLTQVADELAIPHLSRIEKPEDVMVWEMVAADIDGQATTHLTSMASRLKDNRLLPKGWQATGPHTEKTAPLGTEGDADFVAGGDTVQFSVTLPEGTPTGLRILAWLHYQTIPPAWVESMRSIEADECKDFVRMYDASDKTPETIGIGQAFEE
ncbi:MAG TPA: multiheme c-type cytochrome, partial [Planctomycetota bacterium]|nr:multiheme c-type cytochrome [Planctomycetota bacterium]